MRYRVLPAFLLILVLSAAAPAFAHHTFSIEYDVTKCSNMTGTLTKLDWENPHVYFHIDIKDANNQVSSWSFESLSVAYLKRAGIERLDFLDNIGKVVTVRACLARGSATRAAASTLKLADGRTLKVGSDYENGQN